MDAGLKTKWLELLRSGAYRQGLGYLVSECGPPGEERSFCCLGILGLACGIEEDAMYMLESLDDIERSDLLGEWGLNGHGQFTLSEPATHSSIQRKLAAMNDEEKSFSEIADWIETNIPSE